MASNLEMCRDKADFYIRLSNAVERYRGIGHADVKVGLVAARCAS